MSFIDENPSQAVEQIKETQMETGTKKGWIVTNNIITKFMSFAERELALKEHAKLCMRREGWMFGMLTEGWNNG